MGSVKSLWQSRRISDCVQIDVDIFITAFSILDSLKQLFCRSIIHVQPQQLLYRSKIFQQDNNLSDSTR